MKIPDGRGARQVGDVPYHGVVRQLMRASIGVRCPMLERKLGHAGREHSALTYLTLTTARRPLMPSVQLAYVVRSFSIPYTDSSPNVSIAGVKGVVREPRNERRVLVPRETLASKVSAPPKIFLRRAEAL